MYRMISLFKIALFGLFLALNSLQCQVKPLAPQPSLPQNSPEAMEKPYLLLISLDGFRWDYVQRFRPPYLSKFIETGVRAESLVPSFPSKTFPNHYTIATGMYPDKHGLVNNSYFDRAKNGLYEISDRSKVEDGTWYGGTPIWVLAAKAGMVTACYFFVGSEADVQGVRPDFFYKYDGSVSQGQRVGQVLSWLGMPERERPHFIGLYFSDMDDAGHSFGPNNDEKLSAALIELDAHLGDLFEGIKKTGLPVNIMIVSDHGMIEIPSGQYLPVESVADDDQYRLVSNGAVLQLYLHDTARLETVLQTLKSKEKHFTAYQTKDCPLFEIPPQSDKWGDLLIVPDKGWYFTSQRNIGLKKTTGKKVSGEHGFDPDFREMHGIFYANGPAFRAKTVIPSVKNIHLFPAMCKILGLAVPGEVDGEIKVLEAFFSDR